jgi:hypothetical protein
MNIKNIYTRSSVSKMFVTMPQQCCVPQSRPMPSRGSIIQHCAVSSRLVLQTSTSHLIGCHISSWGRAVLYCRAPQWKSATGPVAMFWVALSPFAAERTTLCSREALQYPCTAAGRPTACHCQLRWQSDPAVQEQAVSHASWCVSLTPRR